MSSIASGARPAIGDFPVPIPNSDWQTDLYWAAVLSLEDRYFREVTIVELKKFGLQTLACGHRTLVNSPSLIAALEKKHAEKEQAKKSKRRR